MIIKMKKCLQTAVANMGGTNTHIAGFLTPHDPNQPMGGTISTVDYPQLAQYITLYDKWLVKNAWASLDFFTKHIGPIWMWYYWSASNVSRVATTDTKATMCEIPRIRWKFYKGLIDGLTTGRKRMFTKLNVNQLFSQKFFNRNSFVGSGAASASIMPHLHFGFTSADGAVLEGVNFNYFLTCGATVEMFRRDEI